MHNWQNFLIGVMSSTLLALVTFVPTVEAANIYLINSVFNPTSGNLTTNHLTNLGHTVTNGGSTTLSDYSAFDQVWDMRFEIAISSADQTAYLNFMNQGGNLLLMGEKNFSNSSVNFKNRRNSMASFVTAAGGGTISLDTGAPIDQRTTQSITTEGQAVIATGMSSVTVHNYGLITNPGNGFLVTERNPGEGTVAAWDFGDLSTNARLIVGMDSNILSNSGSNTPENNGEILVENFVNYLDASASVPEPSSFVFLVLGIIGLVHRQLKKN